MFGARIDQRILFGLDLTPLGATTTASLLSQYRFLRAIELGFGLFAIVFRKQIYTIQTFNYLFLFTMSIGVLARVASFVLDGWPRRIFYFFLVFEAVGAAVIFLHTHSLLEG